MSYANFTWPNTSAGLKRTTLQLYWTTVSLHYTCSHEYKIINNDFMNNKFIKSLFIIFIFMNFTSFLSQFWSPSTTQLKTYKQTGAKDAKVNNLRAWQETEKKTRMTVENVTADTSSSAERGLLLSSVNHPVGWIAIFSEKATPPPPTTAAWSPRTAEPCWCRRFLTFLKVWRRCVDCVQWIATCDTTERTV